MAANLRRPTPSTLEEWEHFCTVNDDTAQMRLARAMGYPPGWRVVRTLIRVPIPASLAESMMASEGAATVHHGDDGVHTVTAVQDRIYAGDPATQPDGYYNHAAALVAASKFPWRPQYDDVIHDNNDDDYDDKEYCSTSHKNRGGQLKGREPKFEEGDVVEVLYVEDEEDDVEECEWYEATILKRVDYEDDIRYSVHYHADDAVQSNVREDYIRATNKTKQKKKSTKQTPKKRQSKVNVTVETPKAQKRKGGKTKGGKTSKAKKAVEEYSTEELSLAAELGLRDGWGARKSERKRGDFKWTIKSPEGETFDSKKKAFAAAGVDMSEPTTKEKGKTARGRKRKLVKEEDDEEEEEVEEAMSPDPQVHDVSLDEGDPPWRTMGHPFISRRIQWTPPADNHDIPNGPSVGTVIGWISEADVDSEGNPGFISSKTGKPACLFHAVFEEFEQDFEEWELEELFLDDED
eukprot:CCRYP_011595-RA/>CCRYP_011595-RA protein AED:0.30 eAED:0.30 QI:215/1/1/1/1/1/2/179/462